MTLVKTLMILPAPDSTGLSTLELACAASAHDSLIYEKSVKLLQSSDNAIPNYILAVTPQNLGAAHQLGAKYGAKVFGSNCTAGILNAHAAGLPKRATVHCYTDQTGLLITAQYLPPMPDDLSCDLSAINQAAPKPIEKLAVELQNTFNMQGAWHFQADADGGNMQIMPWADPQHAQLFRAIGINWYALMVFEAMGRPISILRQPLTGTATLHSNRTTSLHIPFKTVYLDFDDTLIVHSAINPHAMKFLQACNNNQIAVHLITRHFQDPLITLSAYNIDSKLFTSIIWITDGSAKSTHIKIDSAIFIDDSFQERMEVSERLKIPTFPPDSVEAFPVPSRKKLSFDSV